MATRCKLCRKAIKARQPMVTFSFAYKGMGLDTVHEACADFQNDPKQARKTWNFRTYKRKVK